MANRVLVGKRGSDFGLFVSKSGDDVVTTSNALAFDSRAAFDLKPIAYGQGSINAHQTVDGKVASLYGQDAKTYYTNNNTASQVGRVSHNQSFTPLVAVRWSYADDLDGSNRAQISFPPMKHLSNAFGSRIVQQGNFGFSAQKLLNNQIGLGFDFEVDSNYIYFLSYECGMRALDSTRTITRTIYTGRTIYYAYVVFDQEDIGVKI
jgi:hypothetical protein